MGSFNASYIGLRSDLISLINGRNSQILDVGCSTGVNGSKLIQIGLADHVDGVEFNEEMASIAKKNLTNVYQGDLNSKVFLNRIESKLISYDYIIFGDVLEHLYDPLETLKFFVKKLNKNGKIIISVPNVEHIELFIQVYLKHRWPLNERGIFDKTHLRWFTRENVYELIDRAGLKVVKYQPKFRSRDAIGSRFKFPYNILKKFYPRVFVFQHILLCERK
jgi:2-polyprenyl-3-methyl-5-hydroxy-6-metoxy-1,4-benzoquinol methylase